MKNSNDTRLGSNQRPSDLQDSTLTTVLPRSSTIFQNLPGISCLLSAVSRFQHHTQLCYKRSISLTFFIKFKPNLLFKRAFLFVLNAVFAKAVVDLMSVYMLLSLLSFYQSSSNFAHFPFLYGIKCRFTLKCMKDQKKIPEFTSVYFELPHTMKMRHGQIT